MSKQQKQIKKIEERNIYTSFISFQILFNVTMNKINSEQYDSSLRNNTVVLAA